MPYKIVKHDDGKFCVHKENPDGSAGESLHCYTGTDAEEKCKDYMKALYANEGEGMTMFSFTDLSSQPISSIDGMAAGTFISMSGREVTFSLDDLPAFVENTQRVIESTRTEKGEIVGLPIDEKEHDHLGGAGWIVGLELDKARKIIKFLVNWTQVGAELVKSNIRRFFSPTIDIHNKIILGGSLTNYPATRHGDTGRLLLRPVELSQAIKEIDMEKTILEVLAELPSKIAEVMKGTKPEPPVSTSTTDLSQADNPSITELLQTPAAVEELGRKAQELAQAAIYAEKRKMHTVQFAATLAGGTRERPFGLAIKANEIVEVLLSLPEKQALAVEKMLAKALDSAVDFARYGFDGSGVPAKPELPEAIKPYAEQWFKSGKPISEFFAQNPELGVADNFNLTAYMPKEK